MRAVFALAVLLLALMCSVASSPAQMGRGSRARTIRGFKNVALSTARGFGKRGGNAALEALSADAQGLDSFPVEWFVDELQNNRELARIIVSKFVDVNQDGDLTADELLRPTY